MNSMSAAPAISLDLLPVPAGSFLMGCDTGRDEEQPVHRVWVDAFLLGVFPVRNRDKRKNGKNGDQSDLRDFCQSMKPM